MKIAPIALFVYNRSSYLKETLNSLKNNTLVGKTTIYVFCDGPKQNATDEDLKKIKSTRQLIKEIDFCNNLIIHESPLNQGLSKSIINGISLVLKDFDKVIVLEDDLVLSPFFLDYMNNGLQKYESYEEVLSICGHSFNFEKKNLNTSQTFFLPLTSTIGWGTWRRSWDLFNSDSGYLVKTIKKNKLKSKFNLGGTYPYFRLLKSTADGKISSWGILWYATLFLGNKLSLFPRDSLVMHIGNEGNNIKASNDFLYNHPVSNTKVTYFENNICVNESIFKLYKHTLNQNKWKRLTVKNIIEFIRYKIKRFFNFS